jgi:DNA invertase Pin-like site-specific DNA recombinase
LASFPKCTLRIDLFLHQQGLDATTPAGKALFQMMDVFAEFERPMIQERVRAGLRRAVSEGKQLGRPRIAPELEERIRKALNAPGRIEGVRKIAVRFGVDPSTVQRISGPFEQASAGRCEAVHWDAWPCAPPSGGETAVQVELE